MSSTLMVERAPHPVKTQRSYSPQAHLQQAVEQAAHLLPAQGPIGVFIHHNTLHAFEDLPFDEAVLKGAQVFGNEPYLSEDRYRQKLARGRISPADLQAVLHDDLASRGNEPILGLGRRVHLRLGMLQYPLGLAPDAELRWYVAETDALKKFRSDAPPEVRERLIEETSHWVMRDLRNGDGNGKDQRSAGHPSRVPPALAGLIEQFGATNIEHWSPEMWEAFCLQALWRVCRDGVAGLVSKSGWPADTSSDAGDSTSRRHRDLLLEATGEDSDRLVHDVLIRFCSAFVDQGFARWPLPDREQGFYPSFLRLHRFGSGPMTWLRDLAAEANRLLANQIGPVESMEESLELLGVSEHEWDSYIASSLLALRGWAGIIHHLEVRGDRVAHPAPEGSLLEFLAIRLVLDRLALAYVARESLAYDGALRDLRRWIVPPAKSDDPHSAERRAFLVFQLAQVLGWLPSDLSRMTHQDWATLISEIESFSDVERRRIFHLAFERHYRTETLDAIHIHAEPKGNRTDLPQFQVVCCIDEREESFRRQLEELAPEVETFGAAGFFSVAMYYRGAADAHYVPLCPVIIRPQHYVAEHVTYSLKDIHRSRIKARRVLGMIRHRLHVGSRTFAGGAVLAGFGLLASVPLVAKVLLPRLTARIRQWASGFVRTPPVTELKLERLDPTPGPAESQLGYSITEMAGIVERLLRDIGLTSHFAPIVVIMGHGSSSLNNPHESAHDCGACGGARGGPNARAFAHMANDPRVRAQVERNGLVIPQETLFVGAYHNTCDDAVNYFDLDRIPVTHRAALDHVKNSLDRARKMNAHERCRRFESAPFSLNPEESLRHVEARSEDLAQVRPEYGHATNAVCVVGRRARTRGLFMDRRSFLVSYDPDQDNEEQAILTRILQAVVPVCGGISLEYYFSYTDPTGWGCGTKLPHNVTSLLGIMDGAASDLRTGLPWQMVEIHEPVRLLFVVETSPPAMLRIMERNEAIGRMCHHEWVQVATLDPASTAIHVFQKGVFRPYSPERTELPTARSSAAWYRGWRDHLGYARIG